MRRAIVVWGPGLSLVPIIIKVQGIGGNYEAANMDGSNNRAPASCFNTASKYPDWGQALSVQCEWPILGIFVLNTEINGTLGFFFLIHFKILLDCRTNDQWSDCWVSFTCVQKLIQLLNEFAGHQKKYSLY